MYPNLKESDLSLAKLSRQQVEVFKRYYGFGGYEPQPTDRIQDALGIRTHNQVAVQLDRAEVKLGCDKDERLKLIKEFKKAYYKEHRPKCPFCKASKAHFRGLKGTDIRWQCGKCHRSFLTPHTGVNDSRVEISFLMDKEGAASDLKVAVNGVRQEASGKLFLVIGDEDWRLEFNQASTEEGLVENSAQSVVE